MLNIDKLSFAYAVKPLLNGLTLALGQGEVATIIGASGSGKTTLFKLLTGLLAPSSGKISLNGSGIELGDPRVAYMTQEDLLLPWRTVMDNLLLVGELGKEGLNKTEMRRQAAYWLNEVELLSHADAFPHELSGGMRQRVALARALLRSPKLLLLDEPFSSLDVALRDRMHRLLHTLRSRHPITILMVTHDFRDALALSDKIMLLNRGGIEKEWRITPEARSSPDKHFELSNELLEALHNTR